MRQVDRLAALLGSYERYQVKLYDDRLWNDVASQLEQGSAVPLETRAAIVNSYLVDNPYGQHKQEANAWLVKLDQERALVRSRTPWAAGYGKQIIAEVTDTLSDVALSGDGRRLIVGNDKGAVRTYEIVPNGSTGKERQFVVGGGPVSWIAVSLDNSRLAVASYDGSSPDCVEKGGASERRETIEV